MQTKTGAGSLAGGPAPFTWKCSHLSDGALYQALADDLRFTLKTDYKNKVCLQNI